MSPASAVPLRSLFLRFPTSTFLTLALIAALALNVATLTVGSVFTALSSLVGAVAELVTTKPVTIQSKQKVRVNALKTDLGHQKGYSAALRNQITAAEDHMKSLDDYGNHLKKQNLDLKNRLNAKTHVNFKGQRRLVSEAVQETTETVSTRLVKATARSTSSVFAESIPYVGIGVIVAVTALELKDACDTMKDLHALDVAFNPEAANDEGEVCGMRVPTKNEILDKVRGYW